MKQFLVFVQKEFFHIFRDRRTMLILLVMPVVQIVLFGFAISTELRNARVAVVDLSHDVTTIDITERISQSEYFSLLYALPTANHVERMFRENKIDVAIVFEHNFESNLHHQGFADMQIITDATDPNTATMITSYASAIAMQSAPVGTKIVPQMQLLYNPSMRGAYNFVPGVMGLILMLICAMMTSISIVREKEHGTMEVLLVSPMRPFLTIIAKAVPYFTLSAVNLVTIMLLSVYVLHVPIAGSLFWLSMISLLFILVSLSLGLLISTIVKTQIAAMLTSGMVLMMPTMLLSGMMFPVENMPAPLQVISCAIPARWYISAVRKIMIQGVDVSYAGMEIAILCVMAVVILTVSLKKFKIRL